MNDSKGMTQGNLWKNIFIFGLPLILSNLLQVFFNISDVAVVGKFAGEKALGAVGSTTMLVSLFTGFLIGLASGINVLVARFLGAKDDKNTKEVIHNAFLVTIIFGLLLAFLGIFCSKYILQAINTKEDLLDQATRYLRIYFMGIPGLALYNFGNAIYSANGKTKFPLIFLGIAGVVNVCLNLLLVIVFKMDVEGVAYASATSQYLSGILIVGSLLISKDVWGLKIKNIRFYKHKTSMILKLGIPSGLQAAVFAVANIFIQGAINTFDTTAVEGASAAMNADVLTWDTMAAFYTAAASFIGQNLGAGNKERMKKSYLISLIYSFAIGVVFGLIFIFFGKQFLSLFTNSEEVIIAGNYRLRIMAFSYCISAFMDCTIAASRGLGKTLWPTIIVFMGSCVFRIIWIYTVFRWYPTYTGLYSLYLFSWLVTGIAEIIYFLYSFKKVTYNLE